MSPVLLYFASGESLYSGAALLALAVAISPWVGQPWQIYLRNLTACLGLIMIVMASPPFAWTVDATFLIAFLLWFIAWNRNVPSRELAVIRGAATAALLLLLVIFPVAELSHRKMPAIAGPNCDHLVVIGDSISSGLSAHVQPWPVVVQQLIGIKVRNLSRPGATMADGAVTADQVTPGDHLVVIELGGNDLLAGESSDAFARAFEGVLAKLAAPGRTIVMFELPLLPNRIEYGRIQRRLAAKYAVALIPKRYFVSVIAGKDGTSDGLHLTDVGAHRMALVVVQALSPILKPSGTPTTPATHP